MVRASGGEMSVSSVDLSDFQAVKAWIDNGVKAVGKIDVLYNNAGNPSSEFIDKMTLEDWAHTIHAELDIVFYAVKVAWPYV